jgi:hypothetical protein
MSAAAATFVGRQVIEQAEVLNTTPMRRRMSPAHPATRRYIWPNRLISPRRRLDARNSIRSSDDFSAPDGPVRN